MFRRLKAFHERTMEEYRKGLEEEMPEWKKKVRELHETSGFLFYMDELEPEYHQGLCTVRGELVKNQGGLHRGLLFLDGEGTELATATLKSHPSSKEDSGKSIGKKRKNEFQVQLNSIYGHVVEEFSKDEYNRYLTQLILAGSLIIDRGSLMED